MSLFLSPNDTRYRPLTRFGQLALTIFNRGPLKSASDPACTSRVLFMADVAHRRRFLSSYNIPPFFAFLPMFGDEWERRGRNITIWHILLIE